MLDKLQAIKEKHLDLEQALSDPSLANDQERFRKLNREYSNLREVVQAFDAYQRKATELEAAQHLLATESDTEMKALAEAEVDELQETVAELEQGLKILLLPKEEADSRNVIIEIRAGTGGDEASLFAADLTRMYQRYAEQKGWQYKVLDYNESSVPGGFKEMILEICGIYVFGTM